MPKLSIIIPTYNNQNTITKCIDSIFNQTFKDFEVIVINDGSTDKTLEVLKKYQDKLKVYSQPNQGAPTARNNGFEKSSGKFVFFCDADIVFKPTAFEKMVGILKNHPQASYVYSSFRFGWKRFECGKFDPKKLKNINYISTNSMIKRQDFPGFDPKLKKFQDWDLWLTMLERSHIGVWIDEVLFRVQTKEGTMSSWLPSFFYKIPWLKGKNVQEYEKAKKIIFEKHNL